MFSKNINEVPKDGTKFLAALYWPSPMVIEAYSESTLKEPAPGVTYKWCEVLNYFEGKLSRGPDDLIYPDSMYAWAPLDLPESPIDSL